MGADCCKRCQSWLNNSPRDVTLLDRESGVELREGPPGFVKQADPKRSQSTKAASPSTAEKRENPVVAQPKAKLTLSKVFSMAFAEPPPGQQFASSYEQSPKDNFAFLIPGDEELFVGGGALNGAVGKLLLKEAGQNISYELNESGDYVLEMDPAVNREVPKFKKEECVYRKLHEILFEKARKQVKVFTVATAENIGDAPVCFAGSRVYSDQEWPFGAVFVNVFNEDKRPYGSPKNVAVLYTVGALGRNKRAEGEGRAESFREANVKNNAQDFVHELFQTGQNVIETVADYNKQHATSGMQRVTGGLLGGKQFPKIDRIRIPIISGGTFIHPEVTPTEVALAILWGVHEGLAYADSSACPHVELMPEKAMQDAYRLYFEERARPERWNTPEKKYLFQKLRM